MIISNHQYFMHNIIILYRNRSIFFGIDTDIDFTFYKYSYGPLFLYDNNNFLVTIFWTLIVR